MRKNETSMAESDDRRSERDMILTSNEYILIRDDTKGEVSLYVGPNKTSLATTDKPVVLDQNTGRFRPCDLATGTRAFVTAKEGEYIVLENPAEFDKYPVGSGKLTAPMLRVGKKVNIPGPASFALWPGQSARVVPGHSLRSNEYLVVKVYDEEAAKVNWKNAVIKTKQSDGTPTETTTTGGDIPSAYQMTMGKLFVIRGTQVSFYVPATGVEVVPEAVGGEERFVREAVSLEVLEYALLLDQDGTKRYEHGPQVVFPKPTERFVEAPIKSNPERAKAKKFRYPELTPQSGIHIRVISDYEDADGTKHAAGEELFITGETTAIYKPRAEHAIIKNGEADLHFAVVIPPGEARYVLDKETGKVSLVKGSKIFLPDPRKHVIVSRALPPGICELLYPGNETARAVNAARLGADDQDIYASSSAEVMLGDAARGYGAESYAATAAVATRDTDRKVMIRGASKAMPGDSFDRKGKFTAPRSVVLKTTYDGAVNVDVWTGYALLLIGKDGSRRVVQGPQTVMLEYDEFPQVMTLSRGKPKTADNLLKTVYLLTQANMVSDVVEVTTKDFCILHVRLAYRVNFEGDNPEKWFSTENYVKFICDHMRSRIRAAVQKLGVEEFYGDPQILRDVILGTAPSEGAPRPGTQFAENGIRIYDAEILGVDLKDQHVAGLLLTSQREAFQNALNLAHAHRKLEYIQELEDIKRKTAIVEAETKRQTAQTQAETEHVLVQLAAATAADKRAQELANLESERIAAEARAANELAAAKAAASVATVNADLQAASDAAKHTSMERSQALRLAMIEAEVEAVVAKASAVSPDLIAAMTAFGDKALIGELSKAMAPLGILGGKSVVDAARQLLDGSPLAKYLDGTHAAAFEPTPVGKDAPPAPDAPATRGRNQRAAGG